LPRIIEWFERHGITVDTTNNKGVSVMDELAKTHPEIKADIENKRLKLMLSNTSSLSKNTTIRI